MADLQIVQGDYYKNRAENIRTRIIRIDAPRGTIVDKFGRTLAGNKMSYSVNIMKANLPKTDINEIALTVVNIIERNGDTYKDDIPILINPIRFTFAEDEMNWKKKYNIPENATVQEAFSQIRLDNDIPEEMLDLEAYEMLTGQYGIELPFSLEDHQFNFKKDEIKWKKSKNWMRISLRSKFSISLCQTIKFQENKLETLMDIATKKQKRYWQYVIF